MIVPFEISRVPVVLLLLLVFSYLPGCGASKDDSESEEPARGSVTVVQSPNFSNLPNDSLFVVPFSMNESSKNDSYALTATAESFSITIEGCLSGYTTSVTESNLDGLEVYKFDRNCIGKLDSFVLGGITYYPTFGDPFLTWQPGDTAIFDEAGEPGAAPIEVIVLSNLSSPTSEIDTIAYGFTTSIGKGRSTNILWTTIGESGTVKKKKDPPAPSFTIHSVAFVGTDLLTEAGQYVVTFACTTVIGITNACETVDFSDMRYLLVEDTYNNSPSQGQCNALFSGTSDMIGLPDDRIAPGTDGNTNGGFKTVTLTGPADLALNPNMMLILQSYGTSYQYFNIDVTVSGP